MKPTLLAVSLVGLTLGSLSLQAATKYWDIDGATPGSGGDAPSGTWDTATTANWSLDPTGASAPTTWGANDLAVFSAGSDATNAFSVTPATTVAASGITVEEGIISQPSGTVSFGAANGLFDIATNAAWLVNGSGLLAGSGGLTKDGPGLLSLGLGMPFTNSSGPLLSITAGTVEFAAETALGVVPGAARTNAVFINGGTLRHSGAGFNLALNRGITIGPNGGTIEVTNTTSTTGLSLPSAAAYTINGGSNAVLTKIGAGRLTFNTTANSYNGKYAILAGSINIPGDGRLGLVPATAQTNHITLNGSSATLRIAITTAVTLNANRGIFLGASGGALAQPGPGTLTYNGIISGPGALKLNSNDAPGGGTSAGIIILGGANTYAGATTIASGMTLKLGAANVIPDSSTVTLSGAASLLDLNGFDETISSLSSSVASTVSLGAKTLTLANGRSTFAGSITGTGALVKNGTSAQVLSGANSYSGATTVNAGTLTFAGNSTCSGPTTVASGATLRLVTNSLALPNSPIVINSGAILDLADQDVTIAALSGAGQVRSNAGHTLTVNGNLTTAGTTSGTGFQVYSCFSGVLTNGSLVKGGTHAMALRGSNTFDGTLSLEGGTLSVGAGPERLPIGTALSVGSGALFQLDANRQTLSSLSGNGNVNLGGGTLVIDPGNSSSFSGQLQNSELAGSPTALGHGLRGYYYDNIDMTNLKAVRDDVTVNFTNLTLASQLPTEIFSGPAGTNTVSVRWLGQVLSSAAGSYTFTTSCDDGRRLWVDGQLVIDSWISGSATKSGTITLGANTKYDIVMEFFNGAGASSARLLWTPPGDLTTNVIPSDYLFLPGPGKLVKSGAGSQSLASASSYSGGTLVTGAGSVLDAQVDSALGSGNVTVEDGATLQLGAAGAIASTADLLLNGAAPSVALNFSGTATIHALSLDGGLSYKPAGLYGAIGSGVNEDGRLTGSGLLNVTAGPASIALTGSASPLLYGAFLNLTSTVSPSGLSGTVTFFDGSSFLGSAALNGSGQAFLSLSNLAVSASPHLLSAVYSGDATHGPRTSAPLAITTTAATLTPNLVVANKAYDGTNTASIASSTTLSGILASDTNSVHISGSAVATFSDKYVGLAKTVNITGLALAGSLASNYAMPTTSASVTADITPKALSVTGLSATNKLYDATTNATFGGSPALSGIISPDVVVLGGTPVAYFTTKSVGTAKAVTVFGYTLSGADATNYSVTPPGLTANISALSLSILGLSANNKPYDGTTNATLSGTASLSGVLLADVVSLAGTPLAAFTNKHAGSAKPVLVSGYSLSGADATNYTLLAAAGLSATISAAPTTCALLSSLNPSGPTSNVTFTATLTANPLSTDFPSGSMSFLTNGVTVSIATLVSNSPGVATASYSTAFPVSGTFTVAAQYPGDLLSFDYQASSTSLQQVVQSAAAPSAVTISNLVGTTLSYGGGSGSKFSLLATNNLSAPAATWPRLATNTTTPGSFLIPAVGSSTQLFYRIQSE